MMSAYSRWNRTVHTWKLGKDVSGPVPVTGITYEDEYMRLSEDGTLAVTGRYAWNGCSPKFAVAGMVFGTPEGMIPHVSERDSIVASLARMGYGSLDWRQPKTYWASMFHDVLYQLSERFADNMRRSDADRLFLHLLQACRFPRAKLYYAAVHSFGCLYWGVRGS